MNTKLIMKLAYSFLLSIVVALQCTAYTHSTNPTASGVMPQVGHCAVDKINGQWIPFGTVITTEDGRVLTVTDRFGDGRSNCLDIFMQSENECWQFGRRNLVCKVEIP
jgi:3D (Asp-Asp-Asp) domain-containing protein